LSTKNAKSVDGWIKIPDQVRNDTKSCPRGRGMAEDEEIGTAAVFWEDPPEIVVPEKYFR
jgi:hypothetical protein